MPDKLSWKDKTRARRYQKNYNRRRLIAPLASRRLPFAAVSATDDGLIETYWWLDSPTRQSLRAYQREFDSRQGSLPL